MKIASAQPNGKYAIWNTVTDTFDRWNVDFNDLPNYLADAIRLSDLQVKQSSVESWPALISTLRLAGGEDHEDQLQQLFADGLITEEQSKPIEMQGDSAWIADDGTITFGPVVTANPADPDIDSLDPSLQDLAKHDMLVNGRQHPDDVEEE